MHILPDFRFPYPKLYPSSRRRKLKCIGKKIIYDLADTEGISLERQVSVQTDIHTEINILFCCLGACNRRKLIQHQAEIHFLHAEFNFTALHFCHIQHII